MTRPAGLVANRRRVDADEGFNVYSWATMTMKPLAITALLLTILAVAPAMRAQSVPLDGPVGPSPYTVLRGWQKPFADAT